MHPNSVKSVVMTGPGKVELQEFPWPRDLEPGAVIAKVEMSGICGTDKHAFDGDTTLYGGTENVWLYAVQGYVPDQFEEYAGAVRNAFPAANVEEDMLPLSIACHIGPGALAIACSKKIL